jgi:hypothetical protein
MAPASSEPAALALRVTTLRALRDYMRAHHARNITTCEMPFLS